MSQVARRKSVRTKPPKPCVNSLQLHKLSWRWNRESCQGKLSVGFSSASPCTCFCKEINGCISLNRRCPSEGGGRAIVNSRSVHFYDRGGKAGLAIIIPMKGYGCSVY